MGAKVFQIFGLLILNGYTLSNLPFRLRTHHTSTTTFVPVESTGKFRPPVPRVFLPPTTTRPTLVEDGPRIHDQLLVYTTRAGTRQ